jgi:hypothetical protein
LASPTRPSAESTRSSDHRADQTLIDREIAVEQAHLDTVYRRLGEKLA